MDKAGGDASDAGDGDDKAPVAFDAFDYALGSLEGTACDADTLALKEFAVHLVEGYEAVLGGGGDQHKVAHLPVAYDLRFCSLRVAVEIKRPGATLDQSVDVSSCAVDEQDIGHNRRDVGLHSGTLDYTLDKRTVLNHLRGKPIELLFVNFKSDLYIRQNLPPFHSV